MVNIEGLRLGWTLKRLRLERSARLGRLVSQQEVADAIGVPRPALSLMECNKRWTSDPTILLRMVVFFEVTGIDQLLVVYRPGTTAG